jgi:hypothetical protein
MARVFQIWEPMRRIKAKEFRYGEFVRRYQHSRHEQGGAGSLDRRLQRAIELAGRN